MFQTLYELLRYISHVPALVPHAAMEDTTLGGYTIPKGTQVNGVVLYYYSTEVSLLLREATLTDKFLLGQH